MTEREFATAAVSVILTAFVMAKAHRYAVEEVRSAAWRQATTADREALDHAYNIGLQAGTRRTK
jgi:hypothetical protein